MSVILREREGKKRTTGKLKGKIVVTFFLDINLPNHKRYTEFLNIKYVKGARGEESATNQRKKAEQVRIQREAQLLQSNYNLRPEKIDQLNFVLYFEQIINARGQKDKRMFEATLKKFKLFLEQTNHSEKSLTIKGIDYTLCKRFTEYLKNESGLSGETPENYFRRFKRVVESLVKKNYILENPFNQFTPKEKPRRTSNELKKEILTKEELSLLKDTYCGNEQVKQAFLFGCFTGLGYAEIKKIEWSNVKNDQLKYKRAKTQNPVSFDLPQVAKQVLTNLNPIKKEGKIFNLPSSTATNKNIDNWIKRAKIDKKITFYCCRHTYAMLLLAESNTDPLTVSKLLGHSDMTHTTKYLNHLDELKKQAVKKLPSI